MTISQMMTKFHFNMIAMDLFCERHGVSRSWVNKKRQEGLLVEGVHFFKIGGKILFDEDALRKVAKEKYANLQQRTDTVGDIISKWKASA